MNFKLKKIAGDASFREFYRIQKNDKSSIIIFAKKEKFKNLIVYSAINKILNKNKILAPTLIKNFYKDNAIEITDLGKQTFYDYIKNKSNKKKDYERLVNLIVKIQKIKLKNIYHFENYQIKFSKYSIKEMHKESDLFFNWYLKLLYKSKNFDKIKKVLKKELNIIYKKIHFRNDFFTHKDFHASNIMITKNSFSLIDNQDALLGNPLYDVASLIDDVRIKIPKNLQDHLFKYYCSKSKFEKKNYIFLKNDFDILSVQRNLKILGIFVRLYKRDNKSNYLKYLPYTRKLIERRMKNPIFRKLRFLMKKHLPLKKFRK